MLSFNCGRRFDSQASATSLKVLGGLRDRSRCSGVFTHLCRDKGQEFKLCFGLREFALQSEDYSTPLSLKFPWHVNIVPANPPVVSQEHLSCLARPLRHVLPTFLSKRRRGDNIIRALFRMQENWSFAIFRVFGHKLTCIAICLAICLCLVFEVAEQENSFFFLARKYLASGGDSEYPTLLIQSLLGAVALRCSTQHTRTGIRTDPTVPGRSPQEL